ncbi:MAG TPA: DUF3891 family protein [Vicinamibacterales bacterium]
MILRRDHASWLCIQQVDHAAMAAEIMAEWNELRHHPRKDAILFAVRHHDNGWVEEDAKTHVDEAGEPLDFISVPVPVKHRIWPRAVARFERERPYESALIAQHALTVHGQQRLDGQWRPFFDTMEGLRAHLLERCGAWANAALDEDYRFVQMGDQLSLIFCNGWTAPFPRHGGRSILKGTTLETTPDPFDGRAVRMQVQAKRIPARAYDSPADLRSTLDQAGTEILGGILQGA